MDLYVVAGRFTRTIPHQHFEMLAGMHLTYFRIYIIVISHEMEKMLW